MAKVGFVGRGSVRGRVAAILLAIASASGTLSGCNLGLATPGPAGAPASAALPVPSAAQAGPTGAGAATIGADGGQVADGSLGVAFPPGALPADTQVTARPVADSPPVVSEALVAAGVSPDEYQPISPVYEVDLGGVALGAPATVTFSLDSLAIPAGTAASGLLIAQYRDGEWGILPTELDPDGRVLRAETERFSLLTVLVGVTVVGLTSWAALSFIADLKRSLTSPQYLEPDKVDTSGFTVDAAAGLLRLDKPLHVIDRGSGVRPKAASAMQAEAEPTGMCIDFANLFGSLLIKQGYPVRVVSGNATYQTSGGTASGGHLWVETVIDGKPYYVDTFSADRGVTLVPLEDAYRRFQLEPGTTFWKELENGAYVTHRQTTYDPQWFAGLLASPGPCTPGTFGDCPIEIPVPAP